jgi:hypothetical protein
MPPGSPVEDRLRLELQVNPAPSRNVRSARTMHPTRSRASALKPLLLASLSILQEARHRLQVKPKTLNFSLGRDPLRIVPLVFCLVPQESETRRRQLEVSHDRLPVASSRGSDCYRLWALRVCSRPTRELLL